VWPFGLTPVHQNENCCETIVSVALPGARGPDAIAGVVDRRLAAL
jgi:hypothetical protein